jgi:ubiquinone/menaquinone biosynthesis C-methylase UbiE
MNMKKTTLELLACPDCLGSLTLDVESGNGQVEGGELTCPNCEQRFPIRNGMAQFIHPEQLEGSNRRFVGFYDRLAPLYAFSTRLMFLAFGGERSARKEILERLELNTGRVLEVSIGPGVNLPYLYESSEVGQVYGLDISAGQLEHCRRLCRKKGWEVDLFLANAQALPFKSQVFDTVFHIGGINFFSDKKKAIGEMVRVAKPGTKIVIADECERLARAFGRLAGSHQPEDGGKLDYSPPASLVPEKMEELQVNGIWKAHGEEHGYCLEFRKPGQVD